MVWGRHGGQQDCSGRKSKERLVSLSGVGEAGTVSWVRADSSGDSKHIKELAIDLQRSGEEGNTKIPPKFLMQSIVAGATVGDSLRGSRDRGGR